MKKILIFLLFCFPIFAQKSIPVSTPEAEGVDTQAIINFLDAANVSKHEFHSYMIIRHGKKVAEGWWKPYSADQKHTLYSVSKTFTASAIGALVSEGKIKVSDKVISFFPDKVPVNISENLAALEIKHLLSMSVGHEKEFGEFMVEEDWIKGFLSKPILHKPGTKFLYNTPATYMLSAIVQKVSGKKTLNYLQEKILNPLSISGADWEQDPKGINVGGYGLRLKTEDLAKLGLMFLNKGKYNNKQILPEAWINEATSTKIMQKPDASPAEMATGHWIQGYCYQMWRGLHNTYRADGANGQYILIMPEQDAVIAITSETSDMKTEQDLIWEHLLPAFKTGKLKKDLGLSKKLIDLNASLGIKKTISSTQGFENQVNHKEYKFISTDKTKQSIQLDFEGDICNVKLKTDSVTHTIPFSKTDWAISKTTKYGPYLVARALNNRVGQSPFNTSGHYAFTSDSTAEFTLNYTESPHTEVFKIGFKDQKLSVDFYDIFNAKKPRNPIIGIETKARPNAPKLIIRGDDMGYSHSGNEALIKCYKEGIQTSIEVIVPSPWFPEAIKLLAQNPKADVGLHFAITSEWDNVKWRPLSDVPSLRNVDGYFYSMLYHNNNYDGQAVMDNAWTEADYEKEMRAQILMAKKYIPQLSHISGHMNSMGFDDRATKIAKKLGAEYNLPVVDAKNPYNIEYVGFDFKNKKTEARIDAFIKMLDKLEDGKTYVYVEHPGLDNAELRAISHIGYDDVAEGRQDVTTIFTSAKVKEALIKKGIELVSYKDVLK